MDNKSKNWIDKGNFFFDEGKFKEAINTFNRVLTQEPKNIDVLISIGLSYRNLNEYDNAINFYEQVLEIEAENKTALNNIGYALQCKDEKEKAIEMYKKSLEIDPCYDNPLVNLTTLYFDAKQYDEAIEVFKKALTIEPFNVANWIDLGRAYRVLKDFESSIKAYSEALKLDKNNKIGWNNLGYVFYCLEKYEAAIEGYTKSLMIDWLYDLPFSNLIKIYKKMIENNCNDFKIWRDLANAFLIAKAYNRAIEASNRTLEINSEDNDALELHEKIEEIKTKFDMTPFLFQRIEEALDLFSSISTSVLLSDIIEYIKYKSLLTIFEDDEIKFKIFETIRNKGISAKLVVNKLIFYRVQETNNRVDYLK